MFHATLQGTIGAVFDAALSQGKLLSTERVPTSDQGTCSPSDSPLVLVVAIARTVLGDLASPRPLGEFLLALRTLARQGWTYLWRVRLSASALDGTLQRAVFPTLSLGVGEFLTASPASAFNLSVLIGPCRQVSGLADLGAVGCMEGIKLPVTLGACLGSTVLAPCDDSRQAFVHGGLTDVQQLGHLCNGFALTMHKSEVVDENLVLKIVLDRILGDLYNGCPLIVRQILKPAGNPCNLFFLVLRDGLQKLYWFSIISKIFLVSDVVETNPLGLVLVFSNVSWNSYAAVGKPIREIHQPVHDPGTVETSHVTTAGIIVHQNGVENQHRLGQKVVILR